jgi:hypothetical protein
MAASAVHTVHVAPAIHRHPVAFAFQRLVAFLKAVHEILAEAQEMRRRVHRQHPFVDF